MSASPLRPPLPRRRVGDYLLGDTLGIGSFGRVRLATSVSTGEKVAIKVVSKDSISDVGDIERVYREMFILTSLKHGNIIKLFEVLDTAKAIMLVMEYADAGELLEYIAKRVRLSEGEACRVFQQIVAGLEYCHRKKIIHRDLKLENILMNKDGCVKIADFGLSNTIKFGQKMGTACGTPSYTAPEMIKNKEYAGASVDVWSLGVILFALVAGYLPFEARSVPLLYKKISKGSFVFPDYISSHCKDIIGSMLCIDPERRADINFIRSHRWFLMDYNGLVDDLEKITAANLEQIEAAHALNLTSSGDAPTIGKLLKEREKIAKNKSGKIEKIDIPPLAALLTEAASPPLSQCVAVAPVASTVTPVKPSSINLSKTSESPNMIIASNGLNRTVTPLVVTNFGNSAASNPKTSAAFALSEKDRRDLKHVYGTHTADDSPADRSLQRKESDDQLDADHFLRSKYTSRERIGTPVKSDRAIDLLSTQLDQIDHLKRLTPGDTRLPNIFTFSEFQATRNDGTNMQRAGSVFQVPFPAANLRRRFSFDENGVKELLGTENGSDARQISARDQHTLAINVGTNIVGALGPAVAGKSNSKIESKPRHALSKSTQLSRPFVESVYSQINNPSKKKYGVMDFCK